MKIKKGFVIRAVGGENVVVPEEHTLEEGVVALCNEYEVEQAVAEADVKRFMDTLLSNGFAD